MGNKIITEKDFWMCSSGAMPAQLQGTRKSNKKSSGEVYITVADTATSSWIDFGCTKNMLLAAILTAVAVVVVVALIVGTGGVAAIGLMGMMAIGAGAGLIGGVVAAVDGALTCGQKNATARIWDGSKSNLLLTGTPGITGDRTMTCSVGGVVKFVPEIKSWTHALSLGTFNYVTQLAGCALGGAGVGAGGFLVAGMAGGSLAIAAPSLPSVLSNVAGSFTGIWGGSRLLFGLNSLANENAYGNVNGIGDGVGALVNGGVPEIGMGQRIFSGQAHPSDYLLFLYLLNIKVKEPGTSINESNKGGDKDGNTSSDKEGNNKTPEEDGPNSSKGQGEEGNTKPKDGEGNAYEASPYKSPTFEEFVKSVTGGFPTEEIAKKAFDLFNKGEWKALEDLFIQNKLNGEWPPNRGTAATVEITLKPGDKFDRYGGWVDENGVFQDKGNFVAQDGVPYTERALPKGTDSKPYHRYEVIKEIPHTKKGEAIPWFGEKGGGVQYEIPEHINDLIKDGYIRRIE